MEPLSLVLGLALGGGVGAVVLLLASRRNTLELNARLEKARKEIEQLKGKASKDLRQLQQAEAEARERLEAARQQANALEQAHEHQASEVSRLQNSLRSAEQAASELMAQADARQAARQQAEAKLRQAEKLAAEASQRLSDTEGELARAREQSAELKEAAEHRIEEVRRLRADLSAVRTEATSGLEHSVAVFADAEGSLQEVLETLLEREGQRTAVLADSNGIVIASAGDTNLRDGIAAVAQLFSAMGGQFDGMVPFGTVQSFSLRDAEHVVVAGRAFTAAGELLSLATYGSRVPNERTLDGAMASLSSALE